MWCVYSAQRKECKPDCSYKIPRICLIRKSKNLIEPCWYLSLFNHVSRNGGGIHLYIKHIQKKTLKKNHIIKPSNPKKTSSTSIPGTTFAMFAPCRRRPSTASASGVHRSRLRPGAAVTPGRRRRPRRGGLRREPREPRERGAEVKKPYICRSSADDEKMRGK